MAGSYADFVESLIYGSGLGSAPNHRDWIGANPSPTGTQWLAHHVDRMLATYTSWLIGEALPPTAAWDGVRCAPWDSSLDLPLPPSLDGSFTGVTTVDQLGNALRDRLLLVSGVADELAGLVKAPFSYRYWAYLEWARQMRQRFFGERVFPSGIVLDRDGTILSPVAFADAFNDLHRNWHVGSDASSEPTPGFVTTAGQRAQAGILGLANRGEEFLRFHREHMDLFFRWLARTEQPPLRPIDMGHPGGWPPTGAPPTSSPTPWAINEEAVAAAGAGSGLGPLASLNEIGDIEFIYHVNGHSQNTDIGPLQHNNYVPRFHHWHNWIDSQWWWREPRFAQSVAISGERTRIFRPVLQSGADFPGLLAVSIVRDPLAPADTIDPADGIGALDLTTGAGTLKLRLYVRDPYDRPLRMQLLGEVLDQTGSVLPAQTVTVLRSIGPAGDHPFNTEFTEDLTFSAAFASDDPARANAAVGFQNARIRITGTLWVPNPAAPDDPSQSTDPGFVHQDSVVLDLVHEKLPPDVSIYQDLQSFSEDQVVSSLVGGVARFDDAFYAAVQDRTTPVVPAPAWPSLLADEVKGLVLGFSACSGLFDDVAHAPEVVIWQDTVDAPIAGVSVELAGPPDKESPSLSADRPQRFTYRYAIVFQAVNDAFTGLTSGMSRNARLRVTARDRAGNVMTKQTPITFFKDANPYMIDGATPWLSVDTRVFAIREGETRLGETISGGQPLNYLTAILGRLNAGTTGAETFDSLAQTGDGAALEFAEQIPNPSTGTSQRIYNFALAKVRLRSTVAVNKVRAFFRLFRYSETNLVFSGSQGYRAASDGAGKTIALLGFESTSPGAPLTSIPFFAEARVNPLSTSMADQADTLNVHDFPAAPASDRVWYFGAWLDINDPNARAVSTLPAASPDGPFGVAATQSLRSLMHDHHQCMVVEIRYDLDPTSVGSTPSSSDNLAQRNLVILTSANPGDVWTRTVEHSFDVDLSRPLDEIEINLSQVTPRTSKHAVAHHSEGGGEHEHGGGGGEHVCPGCGEEALDDDFLCIGCGGADERGPLRPGDTVGTASTFAFARAVHGAAMQLANVTPGGMAPMKLGHEGHRVIAERFGPRAAQSLLKQIPFVFHPTRWTNTAALVDELRIDWNDLPKGTRARLFLPAIQPELLVSLRNARHAPSTVRALPDGTLELAVVRGVTYLPIPPTENGRLAGVLTLELPEGVRAGQRFTVDVTHQRAGSTVRNGGFRIEVLVKKEREFIGATLRGIELVHEQLRAMSPSDRWYPILERRLRTERLRGKGLAAAAGVPFRDPTVWTDPKGNEHPITGMKVRVVLEKIVVLDASDRFWRHAGELDLHVHVRTNDNGGVDQKMRLPRHGEFKVRNGEVLKIDEIVFEAFASDHLAISVRATERDCRTPDDDLGRYVRVFRGAPASWLGKYGPSDEVIDPEAVGPWQIRYRIERA
jgi:hypothetical protein